MWKLFAKYKNAPWEEVDEFSCAWEANRCQSEYALAYGAGWIFKLEERKRRSRAQVDRYFLGGIR